LRRALFGFYALGLLLLAPRAGQASPAGNAAASVAGSPSAGATGASGPGAEASPPAPPAESLERGPSPWDVMYDAIPTPDFLRVAPPSTVDERPAPTPEQEATLREMETEARRFVAAGRAYDRSVRSILERELRRRRGGRARYFGTALGEETVALAESRVDAIARLERFLVRYPEDGEYTPDTMFRLGELYFEKSSEAFNEAYIAAERAGTGDVPLEPDFGPTLDLYRRIVERFPSYRNVDGALYLLGYSLNEMGRTEEGQRAFLALVCQNHFAYGAPYDAPGTTAPLPPPEASLEAAADAPTGYDPYGACESVSAETRFDGEAWFRIGEFHFDRPREPYAFDFAISAYDHILRDEDNANYDLALYKVAWTYYRAGVFDEAVRRFVQILDYADRYRMANGRSGGDLRPEALRQLGQALAYDDWNENGRSDTTEGLPSGLARASDAALVPQDKPYTFEVLERLGIVYYEEAHFDQAIETWRAAVDRFPMHREVPEVIDAMAKAFRERSDAEAEVETLAELARYVEGSPWWNANTDEPGAQEKARALAETALMRTAFYFHQEAQRLRQQCVESEDRAVCEEAKRLYARAAESYRGYIRSYPNDPEAYDLQYNLAEALFWSERYQDAAAAYREVRDSNRDDRFRSEAARRVVESLDQLIAKATGDGAFALREEAPDVAQGAPSQVRPVAVPPLVAALVKAREHYVVRIPDSDDDEGVRPAFAYNNALMLYHYGYWPQARARFVRILSERCTGEHAGETGEIAWLTLRSMAISLGDLDEVRRLGLFLDQRQCTFSSDATAEVLTEEACEDEANRERAQCLRRTDLNALVYRDALAVFDRAEGDGDEAAQRVLYERSATLLVEAVDRNPNDPQAPIALEQAALALERTGRFESAGRLYQRIVDEVGPRHSDDEDEQKRLDAIVANAYFRLAYNANRFFDFDRAVESYRVLADSPRFAGSDDPRVTEKRRDALVNSAIILERLQRYDEAVAYFRRVYESVEDAELKRSALYRIAEIHLRRGRIPEATASYREFIDRYYRDPEAGDLFVQAHDRLAEIAARSNPNPRENAAYQSALQEVLNAYRRSGQAAGSLAAEYAAHARFVLEDEIASFEGWAIDVGRPASIQQYSQRLSSAIRDGSAWAQQLHRRYEPVLEYRRPHWTIAAYVRQGRIFEILATAVLNAPFVLPEDIGRQLRAVDEFAQEEIRLQVEDQVRQLLDEQARPLECVAIGRYALAVRAASAGSLDDEFTRQAVDRLQTYGEERITECIEQVRQTDATMQPYRPGEFARSARGRHVSLEPGTEPPPLVEATP
jgi:tetratricopeptide (TPR) repeat protein